MVKIDYAIIPLEAQIPWFKKSKRIIPRSQSLVGGEILRRNDGIGGVIKGGPGGNAPVFEKHEIARVIERGRGDIEPLGVRVPDDSAGAADEAEGAAGVKLEGGRRVNGGASGGPDGNSAGISDGGNERIAWPLNEWKREGGVWGRPRLVQVRSRKTGT